ncbi:MAG: hypothetical protein GXP25_12750 [Planctomycetes bacterium]|nr:hypothetical protein [Planctomycetota bacterium]
MKGTFESGLFPRVVTVCAIAFFAVLFCGCREKSKRFGEGPVDLTKWTAINYSYPANKQPTANWVISEDKLSVTQEVNADPSIFLSDRNLLDTSISGTWLVNSSSDDDFMGFVFAYQDPGRFYLFDWKGKTQADLDVGRAEQGMCVKIVTAPYSGKLEPGKPFDGKDLWHTQGVQGKVRLLDHEPTEGWKAHKPYHFRLDFRPGNFHIVVKDGDRVIYNKTFQDATYTSGRFGFYNFSQGGVAYRGFETKKLPAEGVQWRVFGPPVVSFITFVGIAFTIVMVFGISLVWWGVLSLAAFVLFAVAAIVALVLDLGFLWLILLSLAVFALLVLCLVFVAICCRGPSAAG